MFTMSASSTLVLHSYLGVELRLYLPRYILYFGMLMSSKLIKNEKELVQHCRKGAKPKTNTYPPLYYLYLVSSRSEQEANGF